MVTRGFTLLELVVALAISTFMSLAMVGYITETMRSSAVQRSEMTIGTHGQSALSILAGAVREAGSGNRILSEVPVYTGTCGGWTPCTVDSGGAVSDRLAVFSVATRGVDCTNTVHSVIANSCFIAVAVSKRRGSQCRC